MSKHDARITTNKYIISMILAVLISLGAGVGCGYLIAQQREQAKIKNKVDTIADNIDASHLDKELENIAINTIEPLVEPKNDDSDNKGKDSQQKQDQEVKNNDTGASDTNKDTSKDNKTANDDTKTSITKEQQSSIAKAAMSSFYSIDSKAYAKLLSETSQNTVFKDKLYSMYKNILAENSLANIKKIIDNGSIDGYYFSDFFNGKRSTNIKSVEIVQYKDGIITAKSTITNTFIYYSVPNSSDFIGKLKGKGITKEQYISMVMLNPKRIKVIETRKDQFDIKNINNKWYIISDKSEIVSTEIIEVIFENKTYTLEEFKDKLL